MVRRRYAGTEIRIYDYVSREPKTTCVDYGILIYVSVKNNNSDIDTSIMPSIFGLSMQTHGNNKNCGHML